MEESGSNLQDRLVTVGPVSSSLLLTLAQTRGRGSQAPLRGTELSVAATSSSLSGMPELADPARVGRLQLRDVIGHGGMGILLRGYDADLGRDLAVKVLREKFRDQPDMVRRFIEEAQIGGQLQHPGVVPVYELGALADRRPYIAMKLIRGRTLAEVLSSKNDRDNDARGYWESSSQPARPWPTLTPAG